MDLDGYFNRIGYTGPNQPTLEVLKAVHRHHACAITYENLDVILQRPIDHSPAGIYRKIVEQGRGGWCYEMNGLLGWALQEIGFDVRRLCGGVMRAAFGDEAYGNHLVLAVNMDSTDFIADVGLGDGMLEPVPWREDTFEQYGRSYRIERLDDDNWRFHNRPEGAPPSFDFFDGDTTEDKLAEVCAKLQSDPESMFRLNLIAQRPNEAGGVMLLGRVVRSFNPEEPRRLLNEESELVELLQQTFAIQPPSLEGLWSLVMARHETMFGDTPVDEITFGPPDD